MSKHYLESHISFNKYRANEVDFTLEEMMNKHVRVKGSMSFIKSCILNKEGSTSKCIKDA